MFSAIGIPGLILILIIALVVFGSKKLPEIGNATGQTPECSKITSPMLGLSDRHPYSS